jgi:hypothetical protein
MNKSQQGEWTVYEGDAGNVRVHIRRDTSEPDFRDQYGGNELEAQIEKSIRECERTIKAQAAEAKRKQRSKKKS